MQIKVFQYDAFTDTPGKGNPAGIVLNADDLTPEQMLTVSAAAGFNETAFILPSDKADVRLRFFTPGHEMDLCGHATVASLYMMNERGLLGEEEITIETRAGILPVSITKINGRMMVGMQQAEYRDEAFIGSLKDLAEVIGLAEDDLDKRFPVVYGSTGIWTLLIPVKSLSSFHRMKPDNLRFPDILSQKDHASIHPFCIETFHAEADMHGRHFSSPFSGTFEDPVTGTASGVMGAYYSKYIRSSGTDKNSIIVEQGQEIGKDGIIEVELPTQERQSVKINGTAVYVREFEIEL